MLPHIDTLPQESKKLEKNIWADYIELLCLLSPDKEISLSDVLSMVTQEDGDSPRNGSESSSEDADNYHLVLSDIFLCLQRRVELLKAGYPFCFLDEDTITVRPCKDWSILDNLYLFLLFASNLSRFSKEQQSVLAKEFETCSKYVLSTIHPSFSVEVFGTGSAPTDLFYGGKVIDRLKNLLRDYIHL